MIRLCAFAMCCVVLAPFYQQEEEEASGGRSANSTKVQRDCTKLVARACPEWLQMRLRASELFLAQSEDSPLLASSGNAQRVQMFAILFLQTIAAISIRVFSIKFHSVSIVPCHVGSPCVCSTKKIRVSKQI